MADDKRVERGEEVDSVLSEITESLHDDSRAAQTDRLRPQRRAPYVAAAEDSGKVTPRATPRSRLALPDPDEQWRRIQELKVRHQRELEELIAELTPKRVAPVEQTCRVCLALAAADPGLEVRHHMRHETAGASPERA